MAADDRGLLAAQAAGGQQGADAYRAAQLDIDARRAQAVSAAYAAGSQQGAPVAATAQLVAESAAGPLDRSANMAQASQSFTNDMLRRQSRAAQYQQGVESARTLIGAQARKAASRIDAETRAKLAILGAQQAAYDAQERAAQAKAAK